MWPLSGREVVEACDVRDATPAILAATFTGIAFDDAPPREGDLFVALCEEGFDGHDHVERALASGAAAALVAATWEAPASVRDRCLVVADPLVAFRRLAASLRKRFSFPVVAVGGSNGKTTTKDMIAALLGAAKTPESMNGWTGIPIALTQRGLEGARALVVEIGIDAPGAMAEHVALVDPDIV